MNFNEDEERPSWVRAVKKVSERCQRRRRSGGCQHVVMDGEEGEWTSSKVRVGKKVSELQRRRRKAKLGQGCKEGE